MITPGMMNIKEDTEFYQQYLEVGEVRQFNQESTLTFNNSNYQSHPRAIYTSRLLEFENLPEPQNSQKVNEIFYKISEELEDLRITDTIKFSDELEKRFKEL